MVAVSCKKNGRQYLGYEINKEYYEICVNRLSSEEESCTSSTVSLSSKEDSCSSLTEEFLSSSKNKQNKYIKGLTFSLTTCLKFKFKFKLNTHLIIN